MNMSKTKAVFNWSGGKDCALALHYVLQEKSSEIEALLTTINQSFGRVSMHGVRQKLIEKQADALGIPLRKLLLPEQPSMEEYNFLMKEKLGKLKKEGFTESIFGDIFLQDLREYREKQLAEFGFTARFPLWNKDTTELIHEFIGEGFKSILVCVKSAVLDKNFVGRVIDKDFLKDLPKNVDPCGENGEFHTFVFDGPIFKEPISFRPGEIVFRSYKSPDKEENTQQQSQKEMGFWYFDLEPED